MSTMERGILSRHDLRKKRNMLVYGIMIAVIVVMAITMLYPIAVTFFNGVKPNQEVYQFPPKLLPSEYVWHNFVKAWKYIELPLFLRNTLLIFVGNMVATIVVLGLAAFSISRLNLPFRKVITLIFMTTLFIPPNTYIIPNFINLRDLGLLNTFWAFWLPAGASAFYLLLLKSFFDSIHPEMLEAARIDGASELGCYIRIAMPLSVPIFSTLAIFVFASAWNDWFWPSMVMQSNNTYPLATAIYKYVINARRLDNNIKFALLFMVMLPPIIVFLFFQKYIIRGVQLSGVKG